MLTKPKEYKIEGSNIENLGSELEKQVKLAAAKTEKAWNNAGKQVGLQVWRIEKFQVHEWKEVGQFYSGDSYIVLNTYKKKPDSDALAWDVHFWLGLHTSQDEAGTAAYKTVELDDVLGGAPVQHREVQGYESELFLSYFQKKGGVRLLEGGVDSGFRHVEPTKYSPRLLWVKGKENVRVSQVDLKRESLNSGDVFILDNGLKIFQFNGTKSGPKEKRKGAQLTKAIADERGGKPEVVVLEESSCNDEEFWKLIGGKGAVAPAESVASDEEHEKQKEQILYRVSDASGKLEFSLVAKGKDCKREKLDSADAFIFDVGFEVFVWIGVNASVGERKKALHYAQVYLKTNNLPVWLPISRILEGGENEVFESYFDYSTAGPNAVKQHQKEIYNKVSNSVSVIPVSYKEGDLAIDVETLTTALKKLFGYDSEKVISIFANRPRAYFQALRQQYLKTVGKDLVDQIKSETMGNFEKLLIGLLTPLSEYKADVIHNAVKGLGTNEDALVDVLAFSTNEEIKEITAIYNKKYGQPNESKLMSDIVGDTSFNFKKVLTTLLTGARSEASNVDESQAKTDAEMIYNAGENRLGTNDNTFIGFFCSRSSVQIQATDRQYQTLYRKNLEQVIISETSGDYKDALIALSRRRGKHFAHRAFKAMKGIGTNDAALVRVFLLNDKSQLAEMKQAYDAEFAPKTLEKDIVDDTSGDYRKLLLAFLH